MDESFEEISYSDFHSSTGMNDDQMQKLYNEAAVNDKLNSNCSTSQLAAVKTMVEIVGMVEKMPLPTSQPAFQVFVAKYNYDPVQYSPNENPEAELTLTAGDYLFIYGEMDEDGFYEGELMNGQKGMVPSNFIEKVPDEDLVDLHSLGNDNRNDSSEMNDTTRRTVADVENCQQVVIITEQHDSKLTDLSPPKDLHLERQLANSCIVAWSPPDGASANQVDLYKVYADGLLVATVKSSDRTKALIEKLDTSKSHKISVRAISKCGESADHQCAITIGRGSCLAPSALDVTDITKTSASISWTAASSYIDHVVSVDGQWEVVTRPGVNQCLITGLLPSVTYTVMVTCVDHQQLDHNLRAASISFVTLPKEFPDPPSDVQVEAGPQNGTLLVTWSPPVNTCGLVTGYCVYANGNKLKELASPTSDHVVLDCVSLPSICNDLHMITVRTLTLDCRLSHDSNCVVLSPILIEEIRSALRSEIVAPDKAEITEQTREKVSLDGRCEEDKQVKSSLDFLETQMLMDEDRDEAQSLSSSKQRSRVPHIEITKDSLSDSSFDNCSDQDRDVGTKMTQQYSDDKAGGGCTSKRIKPRDYFDDGKSENGDQSCDRKKVTTDDAGVADIALAINNEPDSMCDSSETECDKNQVRIFIALFEYNPATMSPNSGALEEELPFSEGQLIKVFGEKDADGFYLGEANGLCGLVPCNMVSEVQIDNPDLAEQLLNESVNLCREKSRSRSGRDHSSKSRRQTTRERQPDSGSHPDAMSWSNMGLSSMMVALYDYDPHELSPNVDKKLELSFKAGDVITVFGDVDYDGFYHGELRGSYGLVPSNFLQAFSGDVRSTHHHQRSTPEHSSKLASPYAEEIQDSDVHQKHSSRVTQQREVRRSGDCQEQGVRMHHGRHGNSSSRSQNREGKFIPESADAGLESCESNVSRATRRSDVASIGRESQKHRQS